MFSPSHDATVPAAPADTGADSLLAQSAAARLLGALLAIAALWLAVAWAIGGN